jgi:hypothetical protein
MLDYTMRSLQLTDLENSIMATLTARKKGKTEFVQEVLAKNPLANTTAVNDEWKSTGQTGSISATLVNKQRAALGLAGNLRAKNKTKPDSAPVNKVQYTGKKRGRKPKGTVTDTVLHTAPHSNGRKTDPPAVTLELRGKTSRHHESLEELEADIDRLLFKVMGLGGLSAIEESLRQTRRLLYGGFSGKSF